MNRRKLAIFVLFPFLALGYANLQAAEEREGKTAKAVPMITQSFAAKQIRSGDTWKIYLNASDPEGKMKNIFAVVEQPGLGPYSLSIIRIKKENQKELSGYIYLSTSTPVSRLIFTTLTLTVWIQDRSGNFSKPAVFPSSIEGRAGPQESPPPGLFNEQQLGPVMITLRAIPF